MSDTPYPPRRSTDRWNGYYVQVMGDGEVLVDTRDIQTKEKAMLIFNECKKSFPADGGYRIQLDYKEWLGSRPSFSRTYELQTPVHTKRK
jgi:hypothetical protein